MFFNRWSIPIRTYEMSSTWFENHWKISNFTDFTLTQLRAITYEQSNRKLVIFSNDTRLCDTQYFDLGSMIAFHVISPIFFVLNAESNSTCIFSLLSKGPFLLQTGKDKDLPGNFCKEDPDFLLISQQSLQFLQQEKSLFYTFKEPSFIVDCRLPWNGLTGPSL